MRNSVRSQTPRSASLLFNNLTASGRHCAYVHNGELVVLSDEVVALGRSAGPHGARVVTEPESALFLQCRYVSIDGVEMLVAASQRSLQVYTADGSRLFTGGGSFRERALEGWL